MLRPAGTATVAPGWAVPAELMRQASRRLALAAFGVALAFAFSIVLNNFVDAIGWQAFAHMAAKNVVAGAVVATSAAVAWIARTGRLTPRRLLAASLAYETVVALGISLGDNLEPLPAELPPSAISWLCVWIVIFPLFVPAPPRWALLAGLASASTWPLTYFIGLAAGNPAPPGHVVYLNSLRTTLPLPSPCSRRSWYDDSRSSAATSSWRSWTTAEWARSGGRAT